MPQRATSYSYKLSTVLTARILLWFPCFGGSWVADYELDAGVSWLDNVMELRPVVGPSVSSS